MYARNIYLTVLMLSILRRDELLPLYANDKYETEINSQQKIILNTVAPKSGLRP